MTDLRPRPQPKRCNSTARPTSPRSPEPPEALLCVTVKPGSRSPRLLWIADELVIAVRERAFEGAANEAVCRALAAALQVPRRAIVLRSGQHSRHKRFQVSGLDSDEAIARLRANERP